MINTVTKLIIITISPIVSWYFSLAFHELAHCIAAKLNRYNVVCLHLGRIVFHFKPAKVSLAAKGDSDYVLVTHPNRIEKMSDNEMLKSSLLLFMSGPFSNLLLIMIAPLVFFMFNRTVFNIYLFGIMVGLIGFFINLFIIKYDQISMSDIEIVKRIISRENRNLIIIYLRTIYLMNKGHIDEIDLVILGKLLESDDEVYINVGNRLVSILKSQR